MDKAKPRAMEIIEKYCREARKAERTHFLQLIAELKDEYMGEFAGMTLENQTTYTVSEYNGMCKALDELRNKLEEKV